MPSNKHRDLAQEIVNTLAEAGMDISVRHAYRLMGLSSADGSVDLSVLYSPKEFLIYMNGFSRGVEVESARSRKEADAD